MANAGTHPRVLGYLGRALSLELSAVQQYMTQASLVELWGLAEAAERFRHETVEEMQHAERIVKQMLALGVAPAASTAASMRSAASRLCGGNSPCASTELSRATTGPPRAKAASMTTVLRVRTRLSCTRRVYSANRGVATSPVQRVRDNIRQRFPRASGCGHVTVLCTPANAFHAPVARISSIAATHASSSASVV